ncbi:uncharacterized protein LOC127875947 isoform X2 [Dreissena polymorpha]|nr:uncharacterized protein LOC127875947 isoform X2 [Dreissena polymorpha]
MDSHTFAVDNLVASNGMVTVKKEPMDDEYDQTWITQTAHAAVDEDGDEPGGSQDDLEEMSLADGKQADINLNLICAVSSEIALVIQEGQPVHTKVTYYWCNFCSFKSKAKQALLEHVLEHRFHCKYCPFQAFSRAAVIAHCYGEHDSFADTARTLRYCTFMPGIPSGDQVTGKRKCQDEQAAQPPAKQARLGDNITWAVTEPDNTNSILKSPKKESSPNENTPDQDSIAVSSSVDSAPCANGEVLPVISSVLSGDQAVSAAISGLEESVTSSTSSSGSSTVKPVPTGLCWNCGYCGFVTFSQNFLKVHLNREHPLKPHKYVAMLASSEEEISRIKASDTKHMSAAGLNSPTTANQVPASSLGIDNGKIKESTLRSTGKQQDTTDDNSRSAMLAELEKKIPASFKCGHCNRTVKQQEEIKSHLLQKHAGGVMYALDMKAVKLRQKRYVFFCLQNKCTFSTKDADAYLEHCDICMPWVGQKPANVEESLVKSLELTKNFIDKTARFTDIGKDSRTNQSEYGCQLCVYATNNNTKMKKHVLTNHPGTSTKIKCLRSAETTFVYFCSICLWETKHAHELERHTAEKHADQASNDPERSSSVESSASVISVSQESDSGEETEGVYETTGPVQAVNTYNGKVSKDQYDAALNEFIEFENERRSVYRPTRKAAMMCNLNMSKTVPPLYQCCYCPRLMFGVGLIKEHMRENHKTMALLAVDVNKLGKGSNSSQIAICPADTQCTFISSHVPNVISHAKIKHNMLAKHAELVKLAEVHSKVASNPSKPLKSPVSSNNSKDSYRCVYCSNFPPVHSKSVIKHHLLSEHRNEVFIYKFCAAGNPNPDEKHYMCADMSCEFTTKEEDSYLLHNLAHLKGQIHECSTCHWHSSQLEEARAHAGNHRPPANVLTLDLKLGPDGEVVRLVQGTQIKTEAPEL